MEIGFMKLSVTVFICSSACAAAVEFAFPVESCSLMQVTNRGYEGEGEGEGEGGHGKGRGASPFEKKSKIAIVGAGPAGVHIASRLKKLGYNKLTLLERTQRVGGKSYTIYRDTNGAECQKTSPNCFPHEMGTCFLHNGYRTVRNLVDEYGLATEIVPEGRAIFSKYTADQWHSQDLSEYISNSIHEGIADGTVTVPAWATQFGKDFSSFVAMVDGVERYIKVYEDLFGKVEFSMPTRPHPDKLESVATTFSSFLETNRLHAIKGFIEFAHTAQGYGYVKSIPALYGLSWISPELLKGYISQSVDDMKQQFTFLKTLHHAEFNNFWQNTVAELLLDGVKDVTTMLVEGFGKIWPTIVERDDLKVLYGVEIESIDRQVDNPSAKVLITYKQNGESEVKDFDFLIYTAPHAHAHKYVKDLSDSESSIFSKLSSFVLSTTLYDSDAVASYTDDATKKPIMYNTEKMHGPETDGGWYADRWDAIIHGGNSALDQDRQTRVAYQFVENACSMDSSLCDSDRVADLDLEQAPNLKSRFLQELDSQKVTNVEVIRQFPWPYFHHYESAAVASGVPWDVVDMQGERKTWWLGASAFFESVHNVIDYNYMIMNEQLGASFNQDGVLL
jgi:hypothetical protein